MTNYAVQRHFSTIVDLTPAEANFLNLLPERRTSYSAGQFIRSEDDEPLGMFVLHEGWVLSGIRNIDGKRQTHKVHRSGDLFGMPSLPFEAAVASLVTLTPCEVSSISCSSLGTLFATAPRLGAALFLLTQQQCTALMDQLMVAGCFDAKRSVAALLLALHRDGPSAGMSTLIHQPLSQRNLGEMLGLSTVHVNRSLSALETDGLIRRDKRVYDLLDVVRLEAFVGLPRRTLRRNPTWLPPSTL